MTLLLNVCIIIPLAGFLVSALIPAGKEALISRAAFITMALHAFMVFLLASLWSVNGFHSIDLKEWVVVQTPGYEFFLAFRFDKISAVYALIGSILAFLVTTYARTYLHRERGYKRFFNNTHFFYIGYTVVVFAGNLETLFIGWEILGVASFLLIAFYRNRYLPL